MFSATEYRQCSGTHVASELEVDRGRSGAVKPPGTHVASEVEADRGRRGAEKPSGTHVALEVVVEGAVAGTRVASDR